MGCCQSGLPQPDFRLDSGEHQEEEKFLHAHERLFPLGAIDPSKLLDLIQQSTSNWKLSKEQFSGLMQELSVNLDTADPASSLGKFLKSLEVKKSYNAKSLAGASALLSHVEDSVKMEVIFKVWCEGDKRLDVVEIMHMISRLVTLAIDKLPLISLNTPEGKGRSDQIKTYLDKLRESQEYWTEKITAHLLDDDEEKQLEPSEFFNKLTSDKDCRAILNPQSIRRAILKEYLDNPESRGTTNH